MNHLKTIGSAAALVLALLAVTAVPASATILTDGSGTQLKTGTSITAESESTTVLHPPIGEIKCEASHLSGKTSNDGGGAGTNVNANVEEFTWSKCNASVTVLKKGTLSIAWTSGNSGTLTSTGTEVTVSYEGFHCIFSTSSTKLGTITGSSTTKGNATLDIEATIPRTGGSSGAFCGSTAAWTGAFKFTSPSALNIDNAPPVASSTTLTDGSGTQLPSGTSITAESEGNTILHPPIGELWCSKSHIGGKTTNSGGGGTSVSINVEALSWSECNATMTVLKKGTLSITATSSSNGTLMSSGTEVTTMYAGFHCIFSTSNTKLGTITGSSTTKGNATLDIEATIPRTGGSSGIFCGSTAAWTGAYKFTTPSTLNID